VFADEFAVLDGDSPLWKAAHPLLQVALQLEQQEGMSWHGWQLAPIEQLLQKLPSPCSLVLGVWETHEDSEHLVQGLVFEVIEGEVKTIRTLEALVPHGLKPPQELEAGIDDAFEILRIVKRQIAPTAWALFTEKPAWDEWLLSDNLAGQPISKADLLSTMTEKGRCVLLGTQAPRHL
jgi:hypothetical protein